MNFSTVPPYRAINVLDNSKYRDNRSRVSSASRDSDSAVNPTRSANNTDTSRRSAIGSARVGAAVDVGPNWTVASSPNGEPHWLQNRIAGSLAVPQAAQIWLSGAPHPPQKRELAGFSTPQLEHMVTSRA